MAGDAQPQLQVGMGLQADAGVVLGYRSGRDVGVSLILGAGARLRSGSVLYEGTRIGDRFETGHAVIIRESCVIGDGVSVWSNSVIDYGCHVGDNVKIHSNCYVAQYTQIEDDAFLAPGVCIANDLYPGSAESRDLMSGPLIGAAAQIGVNVTVLPFVHIGSGCLIGAGSVVTRNIPPGTVAFGNPAVVRGEVADLANIRSRVHPVEESARHFELSRADPSVAND
jgi:acetyltransferase-like isoleucine patch superfamily enzyme